MAGEKRKEEECLFCGFAPHYREIKRGERSLWLVGDSKASTDLSRNRNVCVRARARVCVCVLACVCVRAVVPWQLQRLRELWASAKVCLHCLSVYLDGKAN
jgi:hypothetical protein